jgi:cytoskeleton protein RodZ
MNTEIENCADKLEEGASREELLLELASCLKNARKTQKMSLEEIALALKLRPVYLKALESGDWEDMPGEVYAFGFLKQYAVFLGVDVSRSVEQLKTGHYKLTKPLTFPDPPIAPNKTWVAIAALAFVVLLILFNLFDDEFSSNIEQQMPMTQTEETPPASMIDIPLPPVEESDTIAGPVGTTAPTELQPETSINAPEAASEHEYTLTAVDGDVWLQLSTQTNPKETPTLLREVLLRQGQNLTIYHVSSLLLTCGNPVALQVHIDQKLVIAVGSLGESGKVLRNFKLTAE